MSFSTCTNLKIRPHYQPAKSTRRNGQLQPLDMELSNGLCARWASGTNGTAVDVDADAARPMVDQIRQLPIFSYRDLHVNPLGTLGEAIASLR